MTPSHLFELILALMAAVLLLDLAARRLRLPPSAVMVMGGIGLALVPGVPQIELDPDLTLLLFLPPLLASSAYFTVWRDFRANLRIILQLAVGAVAFTTLVVGVVAHAVMPSLGWAACFALGAIVSPPDAVSAKAVLQGLSLPPRLTTLLEGESLVNDAAGLVLFRFAIAAALTGTFNIWDATGQFAFVALGGVAAGIAFGYLVSFILGRLENSLLNIVGGLLTAWASYMFGEALGVSGVLSTVSCSAVLGWKQHDLLSAVTRTRANAVWSVVVFALESLVFIFIGLSLRGVMGRIAASGIPLASLLPEIGAITLAMIVSRFVWIIPATYLPRFLLPGLRRRDPYPPLAVPIIMSWAGMRGVVSLAVALSVPTEIAGRDFILATTMAVILISILVQGTTLAPLIRSLHLSGFSMEQRSTMSHHQVRVQTARAALTEIQRLSRQPDGTERHPRLLEQYQYRADVALRFVESNGALAPHRTEHFATMLAANRAARAEVLRLHRSGHIHDSVLQMMETELDLEEIAVSRVMQDGKQADGEG